MPFARAALGFLFLCLMLPTQALARPRSELRPGIILSQGLGLGSFGTDDGTIQDRLVLSHSVHSLLGAQYRDLLFGAYIDLGTVAQLSDPLASDHVRKANSEIHLLGAGFSFRSERWFVLGAAGILGSSTLFSPAEQSDEPNPKTLSEVSYISPLFSRLEAGISIMHDLFIYASYTMRSFHRELARWHVNGQEDRELTRALSPDALALNTVEVGVSVGY